MALETGLRTLLLAQSSITTLAPAQTVGGVSFDGVFLDNPAQGFVAPYVVITKTGHDPYKRLDGTTGGIVSTDIDIDCYAANRPAAIALAKAVSDYLKDYTGAAGGSDTINAVLWEDQVAQTVYLGDGRDQRHYVEAMTYQIQHS